jgi:hypothetical protein
MARMKRDTTEPRATAVGTAPEDLAEKWAGSQLQRIAGQSAIDGVDAMAKDMEYKWGVGRLRLLVDDALRLKFDTQVMKWRAAVNGADLAELTTQAPRMQAAWRALDRAATDAGKPVLDPLVWEVGDEDGQVVALCRDVVDAHRVMADGRYVRVYILDEIARLLRGFPEVAKIKALWAGATVVAAGTPKEIYFGDVDPDDELPF